MNLWLELKINKINKNFMDFEYFLKNRVLFNPLWRPQNITHFLGEKKGLDYLTRNITKFGRNLVFTTLHLFQPFVFYGWVTFA